MNPVLIFVSDEDGVQYLIGQAVPPFEDFDLDILWSDWNNLMAEDYHSNLADHDDNDDPLPYSDFVKWLKEERGWTTPLEETDYHVINL